MLLAVGFLWHGNSPHVYRLICAVAMVFIGAAVARATLARQGCIAAGTKEFEDAGGQKSATSLWKRWLNFSRAVIDYEFRLMLVACYILIVGPIALAFRWRREEPIGTGRTSTWTPRANTPSLDAARRQF
jgi:hypothetical protein